MASRSSSRNLSDAIEHARSGASEHAANSALVHPKITLRKLDQSTQRQVDTKGNHPRSPDLSANIKVVFPSEVYTGEYLNHGQSKTVFLFKRSSALCAGKFHGAVLKVCKKMDLEPPVFKQMSGLTPQGPRWA